MLAKSTQVKPVNKERVHPDIRTNKRVVENSNSEFSHGICLKLLIEAASY
jgi:hypothetical protein